MVTTLETLLTQARSFHQSGMLERAETLYEEILVLAPQIGQVRYLLGALYLQQRRHDKAVTMLRSAADLPNASVAVYCALGHALHAAGDEDEAKFAFRFALRRDPNSLEGLRWLTRLLTGEDERMEREAVLRKRLEVEPPSTDLWVLLGQTLEAGGHFEDANKAYQEALSLEPDNASLHEILGRLFLKMERYGWAVGAFRSVLKYEPDYGEGHLQLGVALRRNGQNEDSRKELETALRLARGHHEVLVQLSQTLSQLERTEEALAMAHRAIAIKPAAGNGYLALALALRKQKRPEDALEAVEKSLKHASREYEGLMLRADILREVKRHEEAIEPLREAATVRAKKAEPWLALTYVYKDVKDPANALKAAEKAYELEPENTSSCLAMANSYMEMSWPQRAQEWYRKAYKTPTNGPAESGFLFNQNYLYEMDNHALSECHREWNERFARKLEPASPVFPNDPNPDRRLRIGYVSPDFNLHPVGYFFNSLLFAHDPKEVETFLYYNDIREVDGFSEQFAKKSDHWLLVEKMSDEALAQRIREDKIDILVDLAGHSCGNRLLVFARKPAPIQCHWLGYIHDTLGMPTMDYRITDAVANPLDDPLEGVWCPEELYRLPGGHHCYHMPYQFPPVEELPALKNGYVTFGSFNNVNKVTPQTITVWSRILKAVPNSRLILKNSALGADITRDRFLQGFMDNGIDPARIELLGMLKLNSDHIALYNRLDIALDPFPYNGATSTCEALTMGVPVIARRGNRHSARMAASILTHAGFTEWVAEDEDHYVQMAAERAADIPALAQLRPTVRERFNNSPLHDGKDFARRMEAAFRDMWRRWCIRQKPSEEVAGILNAIDALL